MVRPGERIHVMGIAGSGAAGVALDEKARIEMQALDQAARNDRVAGLRNVIVRDLDEDARSVRLDVEQTVSLRRPSQANSWRYKQR